MPVANVKRICCSLKCLKNIILNQYCSQSHCHCHHNNHNHHRHNHCHHHHHHCHHHQHDDDDGQGAQPNDRGVQRGELQPLHPAPRCHHAQECARHKGDDDHDYHGDEDEDDQLEDGGGDDGYHDEDEDDQLEDVDDNLLFFVSEPCRDFKRERHNFPHYAGFLIFLVKTDGF